MIHLFTVFMPPDVDRPLLAVLHSGYIGQGPQVDQFEQTLADFLDTPNILTLNSGTSALHLALRLAGVGPGDEVISTPMTCVATNEPILAQSAAPIWADIDPYTGLIAPDDVERKITSKTKAILCVDWGGTPCDLDALMELGHQYGLKVIEDAAHAFGAIYKGRSVGTVVDFTCFSFQAIKHLSTVDGGLLTCRDSVAYRRGKLLRWYGIDRDVEGRDFRIEDDIREWGYKFHMNDVAATIGLAALPHTPQVLAKHRENAAYYTSTLNAGYYTLPAMPYPGESSYWLYTLVLRSAAERERFIAFMHDFGVQVSPVHARNDHHTVFAPYHCMLPGVDAFASREVCIPVHWRLTTQERERIAGLCNDFAKRGFRR